MPAIGAAIAGIGTAIGSLGIGGQILARLAISVAASALMQALAPKPRPPGIQTQVTQTGGDNPLSFVIGRYATAGARICPPMSHGAAGKTPNAYLTEVIELGCIAGQTLSRVIINDEYVTLGGTVHPDYGLPVTGALAGFAWVKYYDGTQTTADAMLLAKYGSYPERPWSSDMIGRGLCYAIVTCRYSPEKWPGGLPRFKFELDGIPLYDPRKDTTVGGSGTHRWADKTTWAQTLNPMVMTYNIGRGIGMIDGSVWGGRFDAADLPLASWFASMNECDVSVSDGASGTEPQFRAGFEVSVDDQPAAVIAELSKVCAGQLAEVGGMWKARVGPPGVAVYTFADADILITDAQDFSPFPSFADSYNGVHASYPDPASLWESKEASPLYNATYEAADQAQRLVADLSLPACPFGAQVRRIQSAYIKEERRFRRHTQMLPADCAHLEPLDAMAWTSTANGYTAKLFEAAEIVEDVMTGWRRITARERDAADYNYPGDLVAPAGTSSVSVAPANMAVPTFGVAGLSLLDPGGIARRPALQITWDGTDLDAVTGIEFEVRLTASGAMVKRTSIGDVASGLLIVSDGIIASTSYQARARLTAPGIGTVWTAWLPASSPAVFVKPADLDSPAFQVAGLSVFGGALRSSNFVAGAAGWEIQNNGDAEFNSLVIRRPMLAANAVSDKVTTTTASLGNLNSSHNGVSWIPLSLGAVAVGDIFFIGFGTTVFTNSNAGTVILRRRILNVSGWGAYETIYSILVPSGQTSGAGVGYGDVISGQFLGVEYSMTTSLAVGVTITLSNPTISYQRLVR